MALKGKKFTDGHKKKLSEALRKNWQKEEYKKHMQLVHKGQLPWNTGKKRGPLTKNWKENISKSLKIKAVHTFKKGMIPWNKGIPNTWSANPPHMYGDKNPSWKGGITPINVKLRNSLDYEEWRKKVFERDLYTCQSCGEVGGYLHADHIKSFNKFLELRFEVSNGRTLCIPCHYLITFERPIPEDSNWGHRNFIKENQ